MVVLVMIGALVIFSSNVFPISADYTKISEKLITTPLQDQTTADNNGKKLKIAFLTDGLFSDAGWGAFGYNAAQALQGKYSYIVELKENVPIPEDRRNIKGLCQGRL